MTGITFKTAAYFLMAGTGLIGAFGQLEKQNRLHYATLSGSQLAAIEVVYRDIQSMKITPHQKDLANYQITVYEKDGCDWVKFNARIDDDEPLAPDGTLDRNGVQLLYQLSKPGHRILHRFGA